MKINKIAVLIASMALTACASIPREAIILSQALGHDLQALHESHRNCMEVYYRNIKGSINSFIDDVYAPFIIHNTLNKELENYKKGGSSFYKAIESAGQKGAKKDSDDVLNSMFDFLAARCEKTEITLMLSSEGSFDASTPTSSGMNPSLCIPVSILICTG